MTIDDDVRRATKLLETIMQAGGLTRKDLDRRLGAGPGYMSQLFTGRMELKLRHILAVLGALDVEPGVFFQTLYPEGRPVGDKGLMEEFLKRYPSLGLGGAVAPLPPRAALSPLTPLNYSELRELVEGALRSVLREGGGPEAGPESPPVPPGSARLRSPAKSKSS
jgi:transcriptional regulator with XRE-family HTH domain